MRRRQSEEFAGRFGAGGKRAGKTTKKKRKETAKCGELQEKRTLPVAARCSKRKSATQEKNILENARFHLTRNAGSLICGGKW
jgi:hypothetical protein